ncbi:tetratricopeptide repeat protein [Chloroflexia bacterium SDU3-3]|nr:tetratricopeptide repeat protein [Chloroflexia bacterium SDU3-3]
MGDTTFHGDITAAFLNVGGTVSIGSLIIADPEASQHVLDAATARLAQLPTAEDVPIPDPTPLPTPHRMRLPPSTTFVGRDTELRQLAIALTTGTTAVVSAITGIGGMGKTQLASEFAHRYGTFFLGGVFWLSLADAGGVEAEIAACGGSMQLPAWEALTFADQVQRVRQIWEEPLPRLLIFDNCEDLALLDRYRPATGGCRVLVTSRRDDWGTARHLPTLALATLPRAQSIALLRQFRPDLAEDDPTLDALAPELGDLPLALHVAGSFLQRYPRQSLPDYLAQLRAAPLDFLAQRLERLTDAPTRHDLDVARTFHVSYDRLDTSDPIDHLARTLLARAACFAPGEPIPTEVLIQTLPDDTDLRDAEDGLRRLGELGLLEEGENAWRLHRLLTTFVRVTVGEMDVAQEDVEKTLIAVVEKGNAEGFPARLFPIQTHLHHVVRGTRTNTRAAQLLNAVGIYLHTIADYSVAQSFIESGLTIREAALGPDHPDTAQSLNNLAAPLQSQGRFDAAYPLHLRALAIREATLGPDHPLTAQSLNNLAELFQSQGRFDEAHPLHLRALAIREAALGPDHPLTATSFNNIAALLRSQSRFDEAHPLHLRALAIREAALGPDHPLTATSLNNIAVLLQSQGRFDEAHPLHLRALAIYQTAFGFDHPLTAQSLDNLAILYAIQQQFDDAIKLMQQALDIRTHILGPDHPHTISSRQNLAVITDAAQQNNTPASREEHIAQIAAQAHTAVAQTRAQGTAAERATLQGQLEQQAQWAADGEEGGSPYLALAAHLRALAKQLDEEPPTP